ncbi:unnamed protein product [marine sediment metagenome]|uniref:Uncharacterized protein n=1 Tax=marine sediment metagenome TaxID=412755 RepID=X1V568_9ZZZZ
MRRDDLGEILLLFLGNVDDKRARLDQDSSGFDQLKDLDFTFLAERGIEKNEIEIQFHPPQEMLHRQEVELDVLLDKGGVAGKDGAFAPVFLDKYHRLGAPGSRFDAD